MEMSLTNEVKLSNTTDCKLDVNGHLIIWMISVMVREKLLYKFVWRLVRICGGMVASWSVRLSPDRAVCV